MCINEIMCQVNSFPFRSELTNAFRFFKKFRIDLQIRGHVSSSSDLMDLADYETLCLPALQTSGIALWKLISLEDHVVLFPLRWSHGEIAFQTGR